MISMFWPTKNADFWFNLFVAVLQLLFGNTETIPIYWKPQPHFQNVRIDIAWRNNQVITTYLIWINQKYLFKTKKAEKPKKSSVFLPC